MQLLSLDFETYYDKEYSLSKMTTVEYIRDSRFEVILCGFKVGDGPLYWVLGPYVAEEIKKFDPKTTCVVAHNAKFDCSILCWKYNFNPVFYIDTLSMFRYCYPAERAALKNVGPVLGIGEKGTEVIRAIGKRVADFTPQELRAYGGYCLTDVNIAYKAFQIMKSRVPFAELKLIDLVLRMFTEPVLELDGGILQTLYDDEREKTVRLFSKVYPALAPTARQAIFSGDDAAWKALKTPLSSNPQFAKLLMEYGINPPKKVSPSGMKAGRIALEEVGAPPYGLLPPKEKTWAYAFSKSDESFKEILEWNDNENIRLLCELRVNAKSTIKTTRSKTLIAIQKTGAVPVSLCPFAAHTGRLGGSEWNPQNLPKFCAYCNGKGCENCLGTGKSQLRLALMAPKGHVIVVRDLSAIEARVLAWVAGQENVVEAFRNGVDVYCQDASMLYGRTITKEDKFPRQLGKLARLACGYGLYTKTFQERVRVGILGLPGMLLGDDIASALGVSGENFLLTRTKMVRATQPRNISEDVHATHVASCDKIITSFRDGNKQIVDFWSICQRSLELMLAKRTGRIGKNGIVEVLPEGFRLPNGFVLQYVDLQADRNKRRTEYTALKDRQKGERRKVYGGMLTENIVQALSRIIMTDAMIKMKELGMRVVHTVHDEVLVVARETEADDVLKEMEKVMGAAPDYALDLPLASEGGYARRYIK